MQIGLPLIPIGSVRSLQAEPFTLSHDFADAGFTLPYEIVETPSFNQTLAMSVMSCFEEECQYIIAKICCYKDKREEKVCI